jgi:long-chain acyl-CoA synthetase
MSHVLAAVRAHATRHPDAIAIHGDRRRLSYRELAAPLDGIATQLRARVLGILVDNGPQWVMLDLAAQAAGIVCVPLPAFFSDAQLAHVMDSAGIDLIVTDQPDRIARLLGEPAREALELADEALACFRRDLDAVAAFGESTAKITFTSGTTGHPKGACLRQSTIDTVAESLQHTLCAQPGDRSLCLLPLATLLENIGGVYVPLLAGASVVLPGLRNTGMIGAAGVDLDRMTAAFDAAQPTSVILVPQLLQGLVQAMRGGWAPPRSLRFVAVGGAPISPRLLNEAEWLGLPVYEGYGLSEACSVVCINRPTKRRLGSVGEPLPHAQLTVAEDGEIWVGGALFDGYLGESARSGERWPTGDLGYLDAEGCLTITGRSKTAYATAYGRNVQPEWIEREMSNHAAIDQIAVFGEARAFNAAVVVSRDTAAAVARAIQIANESLPDYAQVRRFVLADAPFTPHNALLTTSGKLRRDQIWHRYEQSLESLYREDRHVVSR